MPSIVSSSIPRLSTRTLDERRSVFCFTHGARRNGSVGVHLGPIHFRLELAEGGARLPDRCRGETSGKEDFGTEADGGAQRRQVSPGLFVRGEKGKLGVSRGRARG